MERTTVTNIKDSQEIPAITNIDFIMKSIIREELSSISSPLDRSVVSDDLNSISFIQPSY